jgi:small subunit ribosomal protein S2
MPVESMKALLEAGVHFGHRTRRWNPKMKPFIFTERNGIHILDLQQTLNRLDQAYHLVRDTVADGGMVLFVGTKKQAQDTLAEEATRAEMPYVNQRWLGGTLTNWRTIRQRIDYLLDLEKKQMRGEFANLPKKEVSQLEYEITRLNRRLGGLREMQRLPNLLFVVDVRREEIAIREANTLGIPVIAMVDTNCDPSPVDHIIPSNDDAIRAIRLMVGKIAEAAIEGQRMRESMIAEQEEEGEAMAEEGQERYLGPSTLAKLKAAAGPTDADEDWAPEMEDEGAAGDTDDLWAEPAFARGSLAERVAAAPSRIFVPDDDADDDDTDEDEDAPDEAEE